MRDLTLDYMKGHGEMFPALDAEKCFEKASILFTSSEKDKFLHCRYLAAAHQKVKWFGRHGDVIKWQKKFPVKSREIQRRIRVGWAYKDMKPDHVVAFRIGHLYRISQFKQPVAEALLKAKKPLNCRELEYFAKEYKKLPHEDMKPKKLEKLFNKCRKARVVKIKQAKKNQEANEKIRKEDPRRWDRVHFVSEAEKYLKTTKMLIATMETLSEAANENALCLHKYLTQDTGFDSKDFVKKIRKHLKKMIKLLRTGGYDGSADYLEPTSRSGRMTSYLHCRGLLGA